MKNIVSTIILLVSVGIVYGGESQCSGGSGAIWALHSDGSSEDSFALGEDVYLGGHKFNPETGYYYEVLDIPDDKAVETNGTVWTDANGDIIVQYIWTIPSNDYVDHDYRVDLVYNECNHTIFTKKDSLETIPEFPTAALPTIIALGGYAAMRIRRVR